MITNNFNFKRNYIFEILNIINNIDLKKINLIENILLNKIILKKNIFVCGNGGSASIANHLYCDFNKSIKDSSRNILKPKIISLVNNIEIMTAISNDISYSKIFSHQLENFASKDDILLTFSCSGSSKNILEVKKKAKKLKIKIINFTGFPIKLNNKKNEYNFNVGSYNYGVCEDVFQIIFHMMSQSIRNKFKKKNNINYF
jgi:phosphoheptose isomerase